jgi:hypothetical protein
MEADASDWRSAGKAWGGGGGGGGADDLHDGADARRRAPPLHGMLRLSECERECTAAWHVPAHASLPRACLLDARRCAPPPSPPTTIPAPLAAAGYYQGADGRAHGPLAPDTIIGWARSGRLPVDAQARARTRLARAMLRGARPARWGAAGLHAAPRGARAGRRAMHAMLVAPAPHVLAVWRRRKEGSLILSFLAAPTFSLRPRTARRPSPPRLASSAASPKQVRCTTPWMQAGLAAAVMTKAPPPLPAPAPAAARTRAPGSPAPPPPLHAPEAVAAAARAARSSEPGAPGTPCGATAEEAGGSEPAIAPSAAAGGVTAPAAGPALAARSSDTGGTHAALAEQPSLGLSSACAGYGDPALHAAASAAGMALPQGPRQLTLSQQQQQQQQQQRQYELLLQQLLPAAQPQQPHGVSQAQGRPAAAGACRGPQQPETPPQQPADAAGAMAGLRARQLAEFAALMRCQGVQLPDAQLLGLHDGLLRAAHLRRVELHAPGSGGGGGAAAAGGEDRAAGVPWGPAASEAAATSAGRPGEDATTTSGQRRAARRLAERIAALSSDPAAPLASAAAAPAALSVGGAAASAGAGPVPPRCGDNAMLLARLKTRLCPKLRTEHDRWARSMQLARWAGRAGAAPRSLARATHD